MEYTETHGIASTSIPIEKVDSFIQSGIEVDLLQEIQKGMRNKAALIAIRKYIQYNLLSSIKLYNDKGAKAIIYDPELSLAYENLESIVVMGDDSVANEYTRIPRVSIYYVNTVAHLLGLCIKVSDEFQYEFTDPTNNKESLFITAIASVVRNSTVEVRALKQRRSKQSILFAD